MNTPSDQKKPTPKSKGWAKRHGPDIISALLLLSLNLVWLLDGRVRYFLLLAGCLAVPIVLYQFRSVVAKVTPEKAGELNGGLPSHRELLEGLWLCGITGRDLIEAEYLEAAYESSNAMPLWFLFCSSLVAVPWYFLPAPFAPSSIFLIVALIGFLLALTWAAPVLGHEYHRCFVLQKKITNWGERAAFSTSEAAVRRGLRISFQAVSAAVMWVIVLALIIVIAAHEPVPRPNTASFLDKYIAENFRRLGFGCLLILTVPFLIAAKKLVEKSFSRRLEQTLRLAEPAFRAFFYTVVSPDDDARAAAADEYQSLETQIIGELGLKDQ